MSLVAYASSGDESDDSDEAPVTADVIINKDARATSDEEESREHEEPASAAAAAAGQISDSDSEGERRTDHDATINNTQDPDIGSLLKGLPEPKAYDKDSTSGQKQKVEEDLEEEVKPKLSQIKDAPKPPPKRAKVRITIPALQDDSDEEEQVKKKPKLSSNVKSGLTALLPDPVHAVTKETNRLLLPYTLKKPQEKKKPVTPKPDHVTSNSHPKFQGLSGYGSGSDSEEADSESTNFFSLGGSETLAAGPVLPEPLPMQKSGKLCLPPPKLSHIADNSEISEPKSASNTTVSEVTSTVSEDLVDTEQPSMASSLAPSSLTGQDKPLSFKSGNWNTMSAASYNVQYGGYNSEPSPTATEMAGPQMDYDQYEAGPQYSQTFEQDEEFLRMQGKKQRGKEEINFVDVNADDFISTVDVEKAMSEETKEYAAHRKKDGPTSQQKRKHHITYLAHQAKETELELKNQWSMNRMTKRQTQAKYGF